MPVCPTQTRDSHHHSTLLAKPEAFPQNPVEAEGTLPEGCCRRLQNYHYKKPNSSACHPPPPHVNTPPLYMLLNFFLQSSGLKELRGGSLTGQTGWKSHMLHPRHVQSQPRLCPPHTLLLFSIRETTAVPGTERSQESSTFPRGRTTVTLKRLPPPLPAFGEGGVA